MGYRLIGTAFFGFQGVAHSTLLPTPSSPGLSLLCGQALQKIFFFGGWEQEERKSFESIIQLNYISY